MATIQENKVTPEWVDDLYQIEMTDPVMGGADGVANRQAKQLGARTQWLKKKYENQEDEFNKYKKSVESATELKAGVTKLTSDIVRHKDDGGYAVTPQAVVDYLASQSASVKDVNELRNYESNSLYVNVGGYYASTPGIGGGLFVADKSDKTSTDNGGTIIVSKNGMRWKRVSSIQNLDITDFGGQAGADKFKSILAEHYIHLPSFKTRQDFLISQHDLVWVPDGHVIIAQGLLYRRHAESRYIPDLPDWLPIDESFAHFDAGYTDPGKSSVTTKYVNTDGLAYNVTYVSNIKPKTIRKYYSGLDKSSKTADLVTLRNAAAVKKYPSVLINSDVFFTTSDIGTGKTKIQGLQVVDNEIIRDFDSQDNRDALVMLRSGWLDVVKKSDNLSTEQIKNKGIAWSAYFGPTLIKNGNIQAGLPQNELSARNIIGQKPNRDIVIIQVQGETGKSGCTIQKAAELLLAEGCVFGYNLDGGGSTQMWWRDCYSFLSSDANFSTERAVGGIIEIRADDTGIFDTGWQSIQTAEGISAADADLNIPAVCYRQVGAEIQLRISIAGNFDAGYKKVITTQQIPLRFTSVNFRDMRGLLVGVDLSYGMWYAGTYLSLRAIDKSPYFTGIFKWYARNSFTY
ncbi:TPA: phosphodiester glycosidase family protein [Neisseria subflava]